MIYYFKVLAVAVIHLLRQQKNGCQKQNCSTSLLDINHFI